MTSFEDWWATSKYRQVVYSDDSVRQVALDAWNAAREGTPSSRWQAKGEPDPHGAYYLAHERAQLALGDMTDDELANQVYLYGNVTRTVRELQTGLLPAVAYLSAAKDRIRWLSRALVARQENAERYLWLRDVSTPPHNFYVSVPVEFGDERYTASQVDAYIDDARKRLQR